MSAVLTKQDVYRYAQEIIAEAGETYADEARGYYFDVNSGQPLCLVAHILHRSGHLTYEVMQEDKAGDLLNSVSFYSLCKRLQLPVTAGAAEVLQELQYRQDYGTPWADCLAQVQSLDAAGELRREGEWFSGSAGELSWKAWYLISEDDSAEDSDSVGA